MEKVRVYYLPYVCGNVLHEEVEIEKGAKVNDILRKLYGKYEHAFEMFYNRESDMLGPGVTLNINGRNLMFYESGLQTAVTDNDTIYLMLLGF